MNDTAYRVTSAQDRDGERAYVSAPASGDPVGTVAIVGAYRQDSVGPASFLNHADAVKLRDKLTELIEKYEQENPAYRSGDVVRVGAAMAIVADDIPHGAPRATLMFAGGPKVVPTDRIRRVMVAP